MSLSCRVICCVALIVICFSSCNNNTERDSYPQADIIAELEHVIINEIFNEAFHHEFSDIFEKCNWIQSNIVDNCVYYKGSNSNISMYGCLWGHYLMGLHKYKTICIHDLVNDVKLCFNFKDWECLSADRSPPCFDSIYIEKVNECDGYVMLANYLNYYLDNISSISNYEKKESRDAYYKEISQVVDSVLIKVLRYHRIVHEDTSIVNKIFNSIERHFSFDNTSNECCFSVIFDNRLYLLELLNRKDILLYFDEGNHLFWIVSMHNKPKSGIGGIQMGKSGLQYLEIKPFNYECAYTMYL